MIWRYAGNILMVLLKFKMAAMDQLFFFPQYGDVQVFIMATSHFFFVGAKIQNLIYGRG